MKLKKNKEIQCKCMSCTSASEGVCANEPEENAEETSSIQYFSEPLNEPDTEEFYYEDNFIHHP